MNLTKDSDVEIDSLIINTSSPAQQRGFLFPHIVTLFFDI